MFPDKFMSHQGEFGIPFGAGLSFWVRYDGSCPGENGTDVIIEQQTRIVIGQDKSGNDLYEVRQILQGDLETKFMTDLGPPGGVDPIQPGSIGMTRPGDNSTRAHTSWGTGIAGGSYGGRMDSASLVERQQAFEMWHRNCFTLKQTIGSDGIFPYLTEEQWLARDDFRIVFNSIATNPDLVSDPEDIAQYGVHIFTDDVPFKELDAQENKYSPALHCVPDKMVGGFQYGIYDPDDPDDEQQFFVMYDFKDYYFEEVGMNIGSGAVGSNTQTDTDPSCDVLFQASPGEDFPAVQAIAFSYLLPAPASLPFSTDLGFACPANSWSITLGELDQNFQIASNGLECEEQDIGDFCKSVSLCHGPKDIITPVAYGAIGNTSCVFRGYRSVFEDHPCRNCLFIQGVFKQTRNDFLDIVGAYSVQLSNPGDAVFASASYQTFTGTAYDQIDFYETFYSLDVGRVFFGSDGQDPNPPTSYSSADEQRIYFENFSDPLGPPFNCDCLSPTVQVLNYGRVDSFGQNFAFYTGSSWVKKTPGYQSAGFYAAPTFGIVSGGGELVNNGENRSVGDPQFIYS